MEGRDLAGRGYTTYQATSSQAELQVTSTDCQATRLKHASHDESVMPERISLGQMYFTASAAWEVQLCKA